MSFIQNSGYNTAGIYGSALFEIGQFTGKAGGYNIQYLKGLASRLGYVFADNTASIKELIVVTALPIIKTNQMQLPLSFWSAQISALQQSTRFLQSYRESLHPDDDSIELIEIKDDGLKLADKWQMHIAFPVNACASTVDTLQSNNKMTLP